MASISLAVQTETEVRAHKFFSSFFSCFKLPGGWVNALISTASVTNKHWSPCTLRNVLSLESLLKVHTSNTSFEPVDQLTENVFFLGDSKKIHLYLWWSANLIMQLVWWLAVQSCVSRLKISGLRTHPCGDSVPSVVVVEVPLLTLTVWFLSVKKSRTSLKVLVPTPRSCTLSTSCCGKMVWNAELESTSLALE